MQSLINFEGNGDAFKVCAKHVSDILIKYEESDVTPVDIMQQLQEGYTSRDFTIVKQVSSWYKRVPISDEE